MESSHFLVGLEYDDGLIDLLESRFPHQKSTLLPLCYCRDGQMRLAFHRSIQVLPYSVKHYFVESFLRNVRDA